MKKFMNILLVLLMCLACMNVASAEKAGDVVTIPITLNNTDAVYAKVTVSYDITAFELVSFTSKGQSNGTTFNMSNLDGLPSGQCATITLRVTDNAEPGKTYNITAKVVEAWNYDEAAATASANGGSVTIDKAVEPTDEPTQAPTDEPTQAPTDEPTQAPTDEPTQAPTDEPTQAPTDEPTQAPTTKPTEKPADKPTSAPVEDDDVPKTGDNNASYIVASVAMILALAWLVSRRVVRAK